MGITIAFLVSAVIFVLVGVITLSKCRDETTALISIFVAILGFVGTIVFTTQTWNYFGAEKSADFYNREFGTKYTASDFFWNEKVIRDKALPTSWNRSDVNISLSKDSTSRK